MGTLNQTTRQLNNKTRSTLYLTQAEPIVGDGTYKSPDLYVAQLNPLFTENINYTAGSAIYTGLDTIEIEISATISTQSLNANVLVLVTSGVNGVPDTTQEIEHRLTVANDVKEITHMSIHTVSTGDTFDFFIQSSENIIMEKAVWIITRYDG